MDKLTTRSCPDYRGEDRHTLRMRLQTLWVNLRIEEKEKDKKKLLKKTAQLVHIYLHQATM